MGTCDEVIKTLLTTQVFRLQCINFRAEYTLQRRPVAELVYVVEYPLNVVV